MNTSEECGSDQNVNPIRGVHAERDALPAVAQLNGSPHSSLLQLQAQSRDTAGRPVGNQRLRLAAGDDRAVVIT